MTTPEQLAKRLQNPEAFARFRKETMQKVLLTVLRNSQLRTPVKTGALRRSETTRIEGQGERGYVGTNIEYAPFVHDGTRFMMSRPFFAEGIEDSRAAIEQLLAEQGDRFLAEAGDI